MATTVLDDLCTNKDTITFCFTKCFRCSRQIMGDFSNGTLSVVDDKQPPDTALFIGLDGRRIGVRVGDSLRYDIPVHHMVRFDGKTLSSVLNDGGGVVENERMKEDLCFGCKQTIDARAATVVSKERTDLDEMKEEPETMDPHAWVQRQKQELERLKREPNTPENQLRKKALDEQFKLGQKWKELNAKMEAERAKLIAEFKKSGSNKELIRNKMKKLKTRRTTERAILLEQWRTITAMEPGMTEQGKNHSK